MWRNRKENIKGKKRPSLFSDLILYERYSWGRLDPTKQALEACEHTEVWGWSGKLYPSRCPSHMKEVFLSLDTSKQMEQQQGIKLDFLPKFYIPHPPGKRPLPGHSQLGFEWKQQKVRRENDQGQEASLGAVRKATHRGKKTGEGSPHPPLLLSLPESQGAKSPSDLQKTRCSKASSRPGVLVTFPVAVIRSTDKSNFR